MAPSERAILPGFERELLRISPLPYRAAKREAKSKPTS
jgi:hypothetical protein